MSKLKTKKTPNKVQMKKRSKAPTVSYDAFVKAWRSSGSAKEVAKKLGLRSGTCSTMAWKLRKKGVKLKKFAPHPKRPIDVGKLNKIGAQ